MSICLLLQGFFLEIVIRSFIHYRDKSKGSVRGASFIFICATLLVLVIGNLVQIAILALLFQLLREFPDFSEAFYHSAVNFATLGYGDIVMSEKHKLLGPLESINGVLMVGVSTAVLISLIQETIKGGSSHKSVQRSNCIS